MITDAVRAQARRESAVLAKALYETALQRVATLQAQLTAAHRDLDRRAAEMVALRSR